MTFFVYHEASSAENAGKSANVWPGNRAKNDKLRKKPGR